MNFSSITLLKSHSEFFFSNFSQILFLVASGQDTFFSEPMIRKILKNHLTTGNKLFEYKEKMQYVFTSAVA